MNLIKRDPALEDPSVEPTLPGPVAIRESTFRMAESVVCSLSIRPVPYDSYVTT
jgi:hypothetical protein